MNWKSWPYWKIGGFIVGVIIAIAALFLLFTRSIANSFDIMSGSSGIITTTIFWIDSIILIVFSFPAIMVNNLLFYGQSSLSTITIFLISLLTYMVLGAILGYIYGKIKNRKRISFVL